jgi:FtsP/CotA-like multicopper oxidase with cupredoxin domain
MPDDMDSNYAAEYPHQPYNGNPHMHPGEQVLIRVIGQGRWQHPFHEHANHVRILARDGNLILSRPIPRFSPGL